MTETLIQIRASGDKPFTASVVVRDGRVVQTAPILAFMKNWDFAKVRSYCNQKGWEVTTIRRHSDG